MTARLITHEEHARGIYACAYGVAEAAAMLDVGVATIRRAARRCGVRKIRGRVVAGFVVFDGPRVPVALPYAD